MIRTVASRLEVEVLTPSTLVLSVAAAQAYAEGCAERLAVTLDGAELEATEADDLHGTRLHTLRAPAGTLVVDYSAEITGTGQPAAGDDADLIRYLRPSRYSESDTLLPTAVEEFAGLSPEQLLPAVSSWVGTKLSYVPGSSQPTDGAVRTLLARQGVCRDFAHLTVALLRALDVPARLVSVYAPGLDPMDFHAVAEAHVDGAWHVVDATALAPRQSFVRIATGRDASDTAFLTNFGGQIDLTSMEVTAVVDALPRDDVREFVQLS